MGDVNRTRGLELCFSLVVLTRSSAWRHIGQLGNVLQKCYLGDGIFLCPVHGLPQHLSQLKPFNPTYMAQANYKARMFVQDNHVISRRDSAVLG